MLYLPLVLVAALYALLNYLYRKPFLKDVAGKRVFITGTDTGFGRELALSLDGRGVLVYAGCYTEGGAEALRRAASDRMRVLSLDVSKVETIRAAKELVEADLPPGEGLWGVVNNAGIHRGMLIGLTTCDDFRDVLDVNFFGVVNVNEIFAPLVKRAKGRIVNVSSSMARMPIIAEPYVSSKAALIPYSDGLRRWMKIFDVHVATIEPGYFKTDIVKNSFWQNDQMRCWKRLPAEEQKIYGEEFFHKFNKEIEPGIDGLPLSGLSGGNKIHHVSDAMTHALFAKHPKARYAIGWDAIIIVTVFKNLPDWLFDVFVGRYFISWNFLQKRMRQGRDLASNSAE